MKDYGIIYGATEPQPIEITSNSVFIASDIEPYTKNFDNYSLQGYKYHYVEYTKDEYLLQQSNSIASLQEELQAAKVLLGVDE